MRRRSFLPALLIALAPVPVLADPREKSDRPPKRGKGEHPHGGPPGLASKGGVPPGQARKGRLPPGLAKKYGRRDSAPVYVAVDPARDDRAWFLIDGRWVLRRIHEPAIRAEVREVWRMPAVPPPVPPPVRIDVHVTVFR